ncbi:MAG: PKD domain-containing protein, partial [Chitinophagaceae bacterium]
MTWDLGDGSSSTASAISYNYKQAKAYTVKLTDNTTGNSSTQTLKVNSIPTTSYTVSTTSACTGNQIVFTSTSTSPTPVTLYSWDLGDGAGRSSTATSIQYSYNSSGNFTPSLTIRDENGCTGTSTSNPSIYIGSSVVDVSFQANGNSFYSCGNTITFSNTTNENATSGIGYVWDFGDNSTSSDKNPGTHTYPAGTYTVTLKASYGGNTGCAPSFSKTVYIGTPTLSIHVPDTVCTLTSFNLSGTSNITGFITSPLDLKWTMTNGTIATDNRSATAKTSDTNQINVTNVNGCPTTTTKHQTVNEIPSISLSMTPNFGICTETMATAHAFTSGNTAIQSYVWNPGDGAAAITNAVDSFQYQYNKAGSYKMTVNATNTAACSANAQITVVVNPDCIDNGYGSTYNPVFGFYSKSCNDKYTITLYNKNPEKKISEWVIDNTITVVPDGNTATVSLPPPEVDEANKTYQVKTIFQDGSSDTKTITVIDEKANFASINTANALLYCAYNSFVLNTDTSLNVNNLASLNWNITQASTQNTTTTTGNNPTYAFPEPGTYTTTLTITDITANACTSSITKTIDVKGFSIDFEADSTTFCYSNPTIQLHTKIPSHTVDIQSINW